MNKIFQYQGYHALAWMLLGGGLYIATTWYPDGPRVLSWSASQWIWFSWVLAAVFQFWVALFWRFELYGGRVTAALGRVGFPLYRAGYVVFGFLTLLPVVPIALASPHTISVPPWIAWPALIVTIPLSLWGMFSAAFYFGVTRASGADHFDPRYRSGSFEQRGAYKYVPNVMYTLVLLALYHPGLVWQSGPALIAAAVHHAFVWVHYFCTEKPDLREIYG